MFPHLPQLNKPCTLLHSTFHYVPLCTPKIALCPRKIISRTLCIQKNAMGTIGLSVCAHMSICYVLLCTQACEWRSSVHTTGFLCTHEYIMEFDVH